MHLDARIDGIENLELLSQHPRLSGYVIEVQMDAEHVLQDLNTDGWNTVVAAYTFAICCYSLKTSEALLGTIPWEVLTSFSVFFSTSDA